jgi:hypothetical protein
VRAGLEATGQPADCLEVRLVQFVVLYRGQTKAQMSTRSGEYVTLRELRNEVGNDAARFFYVSRSISPSRNRMRIRSTTCSTRTRESRACDAGWRQRTSPTLDRRRRTSRSSLRRKSMR